MIFISLGSFSFQTFSIRSCHQLSTHAASPQTQLKVQKHGDVQLRPKLFPPLAQFYLQLFSFLPKKIIVDYGRKLNLNAFFIFDDLSLCLRGLLAITNFRYINRFSIRFKSGLKLGHNKTVILFSIRMKISVKLNVNSLVCQECE